MKITVSKESLENAINTVNSAVEDSAEDIHSHFLFRVRDGKGDVLASNGTRVFASASVDCEAEDDIIFSVGAWRMRQLMKSTKDENITFLVDGSTVTVAMTQGEVTYSSLDPSGFPFWDQQFENAVPIGKIEGSRLHDALSYTKNFISDRENQMPALAAMEAREGSLWATDQVAVSLVTVKGLDESKLSIHRNDVGKVMSFLSSKGSEQVEVREHERCTLFVRDDGGVLGVTRWQYPFPVLKLQKDSPVKCEFEVNGDELKRLISFLISAAKKNDPKVTFKYDRTAAKIVLEMDSAFAGKVGRTSMGIVSSKGMDEFPEDGFALNFTYITKIMSQFSEDTLTFGVSWTNKNGYVRFRHDHNGDDYLTVVVWLK